MDKEGRFPIGLKAFKKVLRWPYLLQILVVKLLIDAHVENYACLVLFQEFELDLS